MPGGHGFGFDDDQGCSPVRRQSAQAHSEKPVDTIQPRPPAFYEPALPPGRRAPPGFG
jgi:hypothetical protein